MTDDKAASVTEFQAPAGWLDAPAAPQRYADGGRVVASRKSALSRYRNAAESAPYERVGDDAEA